MTWNLHQNAEASPDPAGTVKCFVVGCPRSGTTLLTVMLDRHSQLAMTPETSFYIEIAPRLGDPGRPPLRDLLAGWSRLPELGLEPGDVVRRCAGGEDPGEVLAAILELYAERRGKPHCGEKTPVHWAKLDALMADFPAAKIFFIIRDGRDVALSISELPWWSEDLAAAAAHWRGAAEGARVAIARDPARVIPVRYEDLVRRPAAVLAGLMDSIGLSFEPRQLDAGVASPVVLARSLPWKGRALDPIDPTRIGRWRTAAREEDASYLNDALADELAFFGYAATTTSGFTHEVGSRAVGQDESEAPPDAGWADHGTIARCRAHVLARIEAAATGETPFHHLFIERIFPPDFYAALRSHMLDCKAGAAVEDRFQDSAAFVNRRHSLLASADEVAVCLRSVFSDPEVKLALLAKFYAAPSRELAESLVIHQEFEYVFTRAGRFQTIHLDIPPKYLSFVFYLPAAKMTSEDADANATILYDKALRPHYRARFETNSVCVFAPHFHSYHGFASTQDRDVLVMFYVDPRELTRYAAMREAGLDEMAPFTGLLDGIERKLRRHPLIEYGRDASRLVRERAVCLVNAPNGRVALPDAPNPVSLRVRAVIYTAIFGGYDALKQPAPQEQPCDFICFTDIKLPPRVGAWRVVAVPRDQRLHPRLQAKRFKLTSHEIFPGGRLAWRYAPLSRRPRFDLSVWVDGSVQITSPRFVGDMRERLGAGDWAMFVHPDRDCIYDEAQASMGMRKYRDLPILSQVESYRTTVPPHGGLHACGIIVRREPAPSHLVAVHDAWWAENVTWTYQDQLSLPYALRRLDRPAPAPIADCLWNNPWFVILPHTDDA